MKTCPRCKTSREELYFFNDKSTTDGLSCWCKECQKKNSQSPKVVARRKIYYSRPEVKERMAKHKKSESYKQYCSEYRKTEHCKLLKSNLLLKNKYGINLEIYNKMLKEQYGVCAICGKAPKNKRLHVDHSHKTGKVRGLLCYRCNSGIGLFQEDTNIITNAAKYLKLTEDSNG